MKLLKLLVLVGSLFYIQPAIAAVVSDEWGQKRHEVTLYPVGENQAVERVSAADKSGQKPLYRNINDANFWFEEIVSNHTIYRQFNEVYDTVKASVANFARRVTSYVAEPFV